MEHFDAPERHLLAEVSRNTWIHVLWGQIVVRVSPCRCLDGHLRNMYGLAI